MAHLTLVGLSEDRTRLLLVDDAGEEFTLDVDNALRSAVRGEQPRPGHLETRMDSALRPRDIQARIRSGESAEAVAQAAGSTVEKIMPYAAPVLAERAHVAERAQKSSVRRRATEGSGSLGGGRTLADAVAWQLRAQNVDPDGVEWDAYRREDGRWTLTGLFEVPERTGLATFTFDLLGNYVTLDDDDARWLVGDSPAAPAAAPAVEAGRRLSAVPSGQASPESRTLGDDAIELAQAGRDAHEPTVDLTEAIAESRSAETYLDETHAARTPEPRTPEKAPEAASTAAPRTATESVPEAASEAVQEEAPEAEPERKEPAQEQPRRPAKKRGRASVPSWDEIMFGGGSSE